MGDTWGVMTLGVLQARMTSSRLPGKVLAPLNGEPMIVRQLQRLDRVKGMTEVVVATSVDSSDDALVDVVTAHGWPVVRGPLDDVLGRFAQVIRDYGPDVVVRLTADCPLVSPSVADLVIERFHSGEYDYVSNTLTPSFPDGLDVEVVTAQALTWLAEQTVDPHEREHVTLGVYRRPEVFSLLNVLGSEDLSALRWTVDTTADLEFVRTIYERLYSENPEFEIWDVLRLIEQDPSLNRTSADLPRNAALTGLDTGAMQL